MTLKIQFIKIYTTISPTFIRRRALKNHLETSLDVLE